VTTDVLNVFAIANEGLRRDKRDPTAEEVRRYWKYAQIWVKAEEENAEEEFKGGSNMQQS
jgi:CRISPR-associated protein Csc3